MSDLAIRPIPLLYGPMQLGKFTYMIGWDEMTTNAFYVWYIEGTKQKIMVDAGFGQEESVAMGNLPKEKVQTMEEGMAKLKLKPEDIDIVIITHLDRDHCWFARKFTKAKFIVQKKELEYAQHPHPAVASRFFPKEYYDGLNYELIDGDKNIAEGVDVMFTPGHTPGTQSVVVHTKKGKAIITGMCCKDYNLFPPPAVAKQMPVVTTTIHTDFVACYDSMLKIKQNADIVVTLHDPKYLFIDRIG